ncbi:HEAT repeat domain-containing protein [Deltaproteobacteria bacterium OttesenSCG-928-M10]|nr:HEAT repeat domain-containing protein [Deltaproteobacteria bacterium OttesenSCG-928-M10]
MNMEQNIEVPEPDVDPALVAAVRTGLNAFMVALKNVGLYPESNNIRRQSIENIRQWFETWFVDNDSLRLTVEKDRFLFEGQEVLADKPVEQPVVFPFFRDGVQWIEFQEGITNQEIESFINLINRFRVLKEDAEDDLVTTMWEADYEFIKYETASEFWEVDAMIDIATLKVTAETSDQSAQYQLQENGGGGTVGMALRPLGHDFDINRTDRSGMGGSSKSISSLLAGRGGEGASADGEGLSNLMSGGREGEGAGPDDASGGGYGGGQGRPGADPLAPFLDAEMEDGDEADGGRSTSKGQGGRGQGTARGAGIGLETDCQAPPGYGSSLVERIEKTMAEAQERGDFWKFHPQETEWLQKIVAWEENRNYTKDCLDLCLVLLAELLNEDDNEYFLNFLADEIQFALSRADFAQVREFSEKLGALAAAPGRTALGALTAELGRRIISPEVLGAMADIWPLAHTLNERVLEELRRFLLLLPPEAVYVLAPMASKAADPRIEKTLLMAMAVQCGRVRADISELIGSMRLQSTRELIHIIVNHNLPCPVPLMITLTAHASPVVRELAAHALLKDNRDNLRHVFHLISDPEPSIRRFIFTQMGRERNQAAERLLMDYLTEHFTDKEALDREQTFRLYRAFGQCASSRAVSFLGEILFRKNWKSFLGLDGHFHRAGAALALMLMPREWGAGQLLDEAGRSRFRNIRQALRQAEEEL